MLTKIVREQQVAIDFSLKLSRDGSLCLCLRVYPSDCLPAFIAIQGWKYAFIIDGGNNIIDPHAKFVGANVA